MRLSQMLATVVALYNTAGLITPHLVKGDAYEAHPIGVGHGGNWPVGGRGGALAVTKVGGPGNDNLKGTKGPDKLLGKGGRDNIEGFGGKDVIRGGQGSNPPSRSGTRGLHGDFGADVILGGPGDDLLTDGPPLDSNVDSLGGGDGDDWLIAGNSPAARDVLRCGAGRDRASVDRKDEVRDDCEKVVRFS
jgi:Ca2+-binding RTX toxin-like protein